MYTFRPVSSMKWSWYCCVEAKSDVSCLPVTGSMGAMVVDERMDVQLGLAEVDVREVIREAHDRGLSVLDPKRRAGVEAVVAPDSGVHARDDLGHGLFHRDPVELGRADVRAHRAL